VPKASRVAMAVWLFLAWPVFATVFIVPTDAELAEKSAGIVIGVIVDSRPVEGGNGRISTVYDLRIERAIKGSFAKDSVVEITSPGGQLEKRWTMVSGSAHFAKDDKVLLFLVRHKGTWTPADMTLGKFRFVTSTGGQSLLVRDAEDIVGFDKQMRTHVEKVRREQEFLQFLEETAGGREAVAEYFATPGDVAALGRQPKTNYMLAPRSYAILFDPDLRPGRWPEDRMAAAVARPFFKHTENATALGDGGVQMILDALGAWTRDCGSAVNLSYGGTTATLPDPLDQVNVIAWNDPCDDIPGQWGNSAIVATAFVEGDGVHPYHYDNWTSISDADVVIQNGVTGAEFFMATTMTHELGHAIGLRHSNLHGDDTVCQSGDDCTVVAIMNSSVSTPFDFTLQPWDQNAIRAIYPTACEAEPLPPTGIIAHANGATSVTVFWEESAGATSYKVLRRSSTASPYVEIAAGLTVSPYIDYNVTAGTGYQYVVRAVNATGESLNGIRDFTVVISFTDGPNLTAGATPVKLVHFTEVATAINALRAVGGLGAFTFTQGAPAFGDPVRASIIDDLRLAINEAYTSIGAGGITFSDDPVPVDSPVYAQHLNTLRALIR
jgi:hypothetical protein